VEIKIVNKDITYTLKIFALFDTGCPVTRICWNLIPDNIKKGNGYVTGTQDLLAGSIRFGGYNETLPLVYYQLSIENMPHNCNIVLLGQLFLLDSVNFSWRGNQMDNANDCSLLSYRNHRNKEDVQILNFTPREENFQDYIHSYVNENNLENFLRKE